MSTVSKELTKKAGIKPRLQLGVKLEGGGVKPTGPHKVKFVNDRTRKGSDPITGQEREEVEYTFLEDGVERVYRVPIKDKKGELHYLIQRLSEYNYGDEFVLEMKKKGIKNYIDVSPVLEETEDVLDYGNDEPETGKEVEEG